MKTQSLFLYYYVLIIVLFFIQTVVNLLWPHPVYLNLRLLSESDNCLPLEDEEVKAQRTQTACQCPQRGREGMRTQVPILSLQLLILGQARGFSIVS